MFSQNKISKSALLHVSNQVVIFKPSAHINSDDEQNGGFSDVKYDYLRQEKV